MEPWGPGEHFPEYIGHHDPLMKLDQGLISKSDGGLTLGDDSWKILPATNFLSKIQKHDVVKGILQH